MDIEGFTDRLDDLVEQGRSSKHTRKKYVNAVRQFDEWRDGDGEPTADEVQAFLDHLADQGRVNSGIRTVYYGIKRYFSWQTRASELEPVDNYVSEHYKVGGQSTPDHFTTEEVAAMKEAAKEDPRDAALVYLLAATGMRVGELTALDTDDVDLMDGEVTVGRTKRNEAIRDTFPLDSDDIAVLDKYVEVRDEYDPADETDAFMVTRNGRMSTSTARQRVTRVAERTEEIDPDRVYPHLFRHSVGTQLAEQGHTATEIAHYLGHASQATSERYIHLSSQHKAEMRDELA